MIVGMIGSVQAQDTLTIGNTRMKLVGGIPMYINGSILNNDSSIFNSGNIYIKGNIINNHNGELFTKGEKGRVIFTGNSLQQILGQHPVRFNKIKLEKPDSLRLSQNIIVSDSVILIKGIINLYGKNMYLDNSDLSVNGMLDVEKDTARIVSDSGYVWSDLPLNDYISKNGLGIGLKLSNISGGDLKIERGHTSEITVTDGSIKKYYNLYPTIANQDADVTIHYLDNADFDDVNCTEHDFKLWSSYTDGYYYEHKYGEVDTVNNLATTNGDVITLHNSTRITVSDQLCDHPPIVDLGNDTLPICFEDTATLDAGNPGYDFQWSTGETTQEIFVSTADKFTVTVTDPKGCFTIDSIVTVIDSVPHPQFTTVSGSSYKCAGDTFFFTNSTSIDSSGAPMSYYWDFDDGTNSNDSTPSKAYLSAGNYTVTLTAVSNAGCHRNATKQLVVNPLPDVAFSFNDVCNLEPINFTNTTQGAIMSNHWDFGDGTNSTVTDPTHTYAGAGSFNVTLSVTNNYGCVDSSTQTAMVYAPGTADFNSDDANVCLGNSSIFHNASTVASGSLTYFWDFGNGFTSTTANPIILYDSVATYNVTLIATTDHNCKDTISKPVTIYPNPVPDFTFNDVCLGDTVHFINTTSISPGEPLSYEWTFGDGTSSTDTSFNKVYSTQGNFSVTLVVTSSNGCQNSVTKTVNVYPIPAANFVSQAVCQGENSIFQNNSYPNDGSLNYFWDFGDGNTSTDENPTHTYANANIFNVALIATSTFGCSDTLFQNVTVYSKPLVDIGDTIYHCDNSYLLDAQNSGMDFLWSTNAQTQTITVFNDGNYSVTVTNSNGCSTTDSVQIYLNTPTTINLGGDVIDACDFTTLDAGYPGASYLWSTGDTSRTLFVNTSGTYSVTVTNQGCNGDTSAIVNIHQSPVVNLGNDITVCDGTTVNLDAQNSGNTFEWSTGETSQTINVTEENEYWVAVTNQFTCTTYDTIDVVFNPLPDLNFPDDTIVCGSTILDAENVGSTYLWNDASTQQTLIVNNSGQYWVQVTAGNNCALSDTVNITVNPSPLVNLGNDTNLCNGEILTLDAQNAGSSYLWQTGDTTQTIAASSTGEYWVSVTNNYNCSITDTVQVTVNPAPLVNLGGNQFLCANQQALLDAGNDGTYYVWGSTNGFSSSDNSVLVSDSGTYWVNVTNNYNCTTTDSVLVQYSSFSISAHFLAPTEGKIGDTLQFVDVSYPTPETYSWDFKDGVTSDDSLPTHIYYVENNFRVLLTVGNSFCSDTISKNIHIEGTNKWYNPADTAKQEKPESLFEIYTSRIFPNPNNGEFVYELEINQKSEIELYLFNITGQLLYNERIDNATYFLKSYNFKNLKPGIYIYKMVVRNKTRTYKIVKLSN